MTVKITNGEAAVVGVFLGGKTSNVDIGRRVGICEDTVKSHMKSVFSKVGAKDRAHLAILVLTGQVDLVDGDGKAIDHGGSRQPREPGSEHATADGVLGARRGSGPHSLGGAGGLRSLRVAPGEVRRPEHREGALLEPAREGYGRTPRTRAGREALALGRKFHAMHDKLCALAPLLDEEQKAELRHVLRPAPGAMPVPTPRPEVCATCGKPAYPHPYRHPVTTRVHPSAQMTPAQRRANGF